MKTAVVHEWLSTFAGSERVLEQILLQYPESDLFATVDFLKAEERAFLHGHIPNTTFIQKLPFSRRYFRNYLPLMPMAIEQHDLSEYELIISSNHACSKGVITRPDQLHVCYMHSPARYAWDLQEQYLKQIGRRRGLGSFLIRAAMHYLRVWDRVSADRVDLFLANSAFIASRIRKYYRRRSTVVHPPVDTDRFQLCNNKENYYLAAGRLAPYKRTDLIVEAFSTQMKTRRLIVVGDGPEMERIKRIAGPNVEILGHQSDHMLIDLIQRARACIFAAIEDFGIATVEAQACGTPVIALGRGGALEIVVPGRTGVLFSDQTVAAIVTAVSELESRTFVPEILRNNAERFHPRRFKSRLASVIDRAVESRRKSRLNNRSEPVAVSSDTGVL